MLDTGPKWREQQYEVNLLSVFFVLFSFFFFSPPLKVYIELTCQFRWFRLTSRYTNSLVRSKTAPSSCSA